MPARQMPLTQSRAASTKLSRATLLDGAAAERHTLARGHAAHTPPQSLADSRRRSKRPAQQRSVHSEARLGHDANRALEGGCSSSRGNRGTCMASACMLAGSPTSGAHDGRQRDTGESSDARRHASRDVEQVTSDRAAVHLLPTRQAHTHNTRAVTETERKTRDKRHETRDTRLRNTLRVQAELHRAHSTNTRGESTLQTRRTAVRTVTAGVRTAAAVARDVPLAVAVGDVGDGAEPTLLAETAAGLTRAPSCTALARHWRNRRRRHRRHAGASPQSTSVSSTFSIAEACQKRHAHTHTHTQPQTDTVTDTEAEGEGEGDAASRKEKWVRRLSRGRKA